MEPPSSLKVPGAEEGEGVAGNACDRGVGHGAGAYGAVGKESRVP